MKPKVGHSWYALAVPAIVAGIHFGRSGVSKWAGDIVVYDNQAKPERMLLGTQFLITRDYLFAGRCAFDWILLWRIDEAISRGQDRHDHVATSPSAYFPPYLHLYGRRRRRSFRNSYAIAQFFKFEGRTEEIEAVWLVEAPSVLV